MERVWGFERYRYARARGRCHVAVDRKRLGRFDYLGAYSTTGVRPDSDFFFWKITTRYQDLGELGAALNGDARPYYARTTVLVTNLGVHFKLGRESSLVWVTRLADGRPVKNARCRY